MVATHLCFARAILFVIYKGLSLHEYQEWAADQRMERSAYRPLPLRFLFDSDIESTNENCMIQSLSRILTEYRVIFRDMTGIHVTARSNESLLEFVGIDIDARATRNKPYPRPKLAVWLRKTRRIRTISSAGRNLEDRFRATVLSTKSTNSPGVCLVKASYEVERTVIGSHVTGKSMPLRSVLHCVGAEGITGGIDSRCSVWEMQYCSLQRVPNVLGGFRFRLRPSR